MDEVVDKLQKVGYQVMGADSHVKSRDSRIAQTPMSNVQWSGQRGASRCYPTDMETQTFLGKYGREYVSYDLSGEPNFSPFETTHVRISNMSNNRQLNFSSAGKRTLQTEWAKQNNIYTLSELNDYMSKHELTWHECSDGVTLRLVPTKINARFGHSGGVSETGAMDVQTNIATDGLFRTIGSEQGKAKITVSKKFVKTEEQLNEFVLNTSKNVGNEFINGATEALAMSAIPLTINAVNQITKVAQGELEVSEAAKNIGKTTIEVATAGGAENAAVEFVNTSLKNSSSQLMNNIAQNNCLSKIITVSLVVKDAAFRYINGEIDEIEFIDEIGENGTKMVSGIIGSKIGGDVGGLVGIFVGTFALPGVGSATGFIVGEAIGKAVGAMIATIACGSIMASFNSAEVMAECRRQISKQIDETIIALERANIELAKMANQSATIKRQKIQSGYEKILIGAMSNNYVDINKGIAETLEVYGGSLLFETQDDFDDFFFSGEKISL